MLLKKFIEKTIESVQTESGVIYLEFDLAVHPSHGEYVEVYDDGNTIPSGTSRIRFTMEFKD